MAGIFSQLPTAIQVSPYANVLNTYAGVFQKAYTTAAAPPQQQVDNRPQAETHSKEPVYGDTYIGRYNGEYVLTDASGRVIGSAQTFLEGVSQSRLDTYYKTRVLYPDERPYYETIARGASPTDQTSEGAALRGFRYDVARQQQDQLSLQSRNAAYDAALAGDTRALAGVGVSVERFAQIKATAPQYDTTQAGSPYIVGTGAPNQPIGPTYETTTGQTLTPVSLGQAAPQYKLQTAVIPFFTAAPSPTGGMITQGGQLTANQRQEILGKAQENYLQIVAGSTGRQLAELRQNWGTGGVLDVSKSKEWASYQKQAEQAITNAEKTGHGFLYGYGDISVKSQTEHGVYAAPEQRISMVGPEDYTYVYVGTGGGSLKAGVDLTPTTYYNPNTGIVDVAVPDVKALGGTTTIQGEEIIYSFPQRYTPPQGEFYDLITAKPTEGYRFAPPPKSTATDIITTYPEPRPEAEKFQRIETLTGELNLGIAKVPIYAYYTTGSKTASQIYGEQVDRELQEAMSQRYAEYAKRGGASIPEEVFGRIQDVGAYSVGSAKKMVVGFGLAESGAIASLSSRIREARGEEQYLPTREAVEREIPAGLSLGGKEYAELVAYSLIPKATGFAGETIVMANPQIARLPLIKQTAEYAVSQSPRYGATTLARESGKVVGEMLFVGGVAVASGIDESGFNPHNALIGGLTAGTIVGVGTYGPKIGSKIIQSGFGAAKSTSSSALNIISEKAQAGSDYLFEKASAYNMIPEQDLTARQRLFIVGEVYGSKFLGGVSNRAGGLAERLQYAEAPDIFSKTEYISQEEAKARKAVGVLSERDIASGSEYVKGRAQYEYQKAQGLSRYGKQQLAKAEGKLQSLEPTLTQEEIASVKMKLGSVSAPYIEQQEQLYSFDAMLERIRAKQEISAAKEMLKQAAKAEKTYTSLVENPHPELASEAQRSAATQKLIASMYVPPEKYTPISIKSGYEMFGVGSDFYRQPITNIRFGGIDATFKTWFPKKIVLSGNKFTSFVEAQPTKAAQLPAGEFVGGVESGAGQMTAQAQPKVMIRTTGVLLRPIPQLTQEPAPQETTAQPTITTPQTSESLTTINLKNIQASIEQLKAASKSETTLSMPKEITRQTQQQRTNINLENIYSQVQLPTLSQIEATSIERAQTTALLKSTARTQAQVQIPTQTQVQSQERIMTRAQITLLAPPLKAHAKIKKTFVKQRFRLPKLSIGERLPPLSDIISITQSQLKFGKATSPSFIKRPSAIKYTRNVAGFIPTIEQITGAKQKRYGWRF